MKKLIYINACIRRENSRTRSVAEPVLKKLGESYEIEEIDLTETGLRALDAEAYRMREQGIHNPEAIEYARKLAAADRVVIAMPFWDMSFPAVFKVFCENVTINGITFTEKSDGNIEGLCAADKIMLITTRGAEIEDFSVMEQASPYIRSVSYLWGIDELVVVSAIGMDACDDNTRSERINEAIRHGLDLCEEISD